MKQATKIGRSTTRSAGAAAEAMPPPWISLSACALALATGAAAGAEPVLSYTIELAQAAPPEVTVIVVGRGDASGTTSFALCDDWAQARDCQAQVADFVVRGSDGRILTPETPEPRVRTVRHRPRERLTASYQLLASDAASAHSPLLRPDLFHAIGLTALAYPKHLSPSRRGRFEGRWRGFREAGWQVASSFGLGERFRYEGRLGDFRQSLFLAGRFRTYRHRTHGSDVTMALAGSEWAFSDAEMQAFLLSLVKQTREFFRDTRHAPLLVSVVPYGDNRPGSLTTAGTGLTQAFSLLVSPGASLRSGMALPRFLAHEMFHQWTGRRIREGEPEHAGEWFFEGFTDFYARRLLLRAGQITAAEFVEDLDRTTVRYWFSPARNATADEIVQGYWRDPGLKEISYARGDLLALSVDAEIRRVSAGRSSLDDVMRQILRLALRSDTPFDTPRLLELITQHTSAPFAERARRVVADGATVTLQAEALLPCLLLTEETLGPFDLGFDLEASLSSRAVTSVRAGSLAAQAGLRDGQELLRWSVERGNIERPVLLTVRDGSGERRIEYLPQGDPIPVPRVRLNPAAAECRESL